LSEALKSYIEMIKNISAPLKKLQEIKSPTFELQNLLATGGAISTMIGKIGSAGSSVNTAALYDSTMSVRTMGENVLVSFDSPEVKAIVEESNEAAEKIKEKVNFEQSNEHLFNYYKDLADLAIVSKGTEEMCKQISRKENEKSIWSIIKNWFTGIKSRITHMLAKMEGIIGSIGEELKSTLGELEKTIEKSLEKFVESLNNLVSKVQGFALNLIRKMLNFAQEIQKLAQECKWNVKEILIELPSFEVEVFTVLTLPIPIPKISTPKLSINFAPIKE